MAFSSQLGWLEWLGAGWGFLSLSRRSFCVAGPLVRVAQGSKGEHSKRISLRCKQWFESCLLMSNWSKQVNNRAQSSCGRELYKAMSSSNSGFLTCIHSSQEEGQVAWYSHLFKNFPEFVVIHTVKGFAIVNKVEVDVFLELSCFFYDPQMLAIWCLVSLPFLNQAWTSGSSLLMYCWSLLLLWSRFSCVRLCATP